MGKIYAAIICAKMLYHNWSFVVISLPKIPCHKLAHLNCSFSIIKVWSIFVHHDFYAHNYSWWKDTHKDNKGRFLSFVSSTVKLNHKTDDSIAGFLGKKVIVR